MAQPAGFPKNVPYEPLALRKNACISAEFAIKKPVVLTPIKCVKIASLILTMLGLITVGALAHEGQLDGLSVEAGEAMMGAGAGLLILYAYGARLYYKKLYVTIRQVDWNLGTHKEFIEAGRVQRAKEALSAKSFDMIDPNYSLVTVPLYNGLIALEGETLKNTADFSLIGNYTKCRAFRAETIDQAFTEIFALNPDFVKVTNNDPYDKSNQWWANAHAEKMAASKYNSNPVINLMGFQKLEQYTCVIPGLGKSSMANPSAHEATLTETLCINAKLLSSGWSYLY